MLADSVSMEEKEDSWAKHLVVAAIDIGTTHSGYAFSLLPSHGNLDQDIPIVTKNWQHAGTTGTPKTPTCLLLDQDGQFDSFGYDAEDKYAQLADTEEQEGWYLFRNFKMILYQVQDLKRGLKIKDENKKEFSALKVFSLSIRYLKDDMLNVVKERVPNIGENDIYWVLTVPAIWSDKAKQFMRDAAEQAGIETDHLRLALEPECASVLCRRVPMKRTAFQSGAMSTAGIEAMGPGSTYLVLDLGGGTMDVTVHQITKEGTLRELHRASGGPWGGNRVNEAFTQFMLKLVGAKVWMKFKEETIGDWLYLQRNFEQCKCAINKPGKLVLRAPASLFLLHTAEGLEGLSFEESLKRSKFEKNIVHKGDKLLIEYDTFLNEFYKTTLDELACHIHGLEQEVGQAINTCLLIGGFSNSAIVKNFLKDTFPKKMFVRPEDSTVAVVKGAVYYGRFPEVIASRMCRYTYGFEWDEEFNHMKHPPSKKLKTDDGHVCTEVFKKLVERDEVLKLGQKTEEIPVYVKYKYQDKIEFPFFQSSEKSPRFVTDPGCTHLGKLEVPIRGEGLNRYVLLSVKFGGTEIKAIGRNPESGETATVKFDLL